MQTSWCNRIRNFRTVVLIIVFFLLGIGSTDAYQYKPAIVTQGAFLLSKTPDKVRDNVKVHSLIGYLPTGTKVFFAMPKKLTNLAKGIEEVYYEVFSVLGISGLLREDLFVPVKDNPIGVSVASYEIPIFQPDDTSRVRFKLGRYGGNYLEIIGETESGFFDVVLHRAHPTDTLPEKEHGRLKKIYVEIGHVSIVKPGHVDSSVINTLQWSSGMKPDNTLINDIIDKLKDKLGDDVNKARTFLREVNDLQCILAGDANAEFGFKFFSNGLSFNLDLSFKEQGHKYVFEKYEIRANHEKRVFTLLRNIRCDGYEPERLVCITIQEGIYSPDKRICVKLKDLAQSKSRWITSLQGSEIPLKMIRISGWPEYDRAIKELDKLSTSGSSYLMGLSGGERNIILNFILSKISHFEHRDFLIKR